MGRFGKWLWRSSVLLLVLLVLLLTAAAIFLNTASGTRWAIAYLDDTLPGELSSGEFDGTFWRGLRFRNIAYSNEKLSIEAVDLEVGIDWPSIATGQITLKKVNAKRLTYRDISPRAVTPKPFELAMQELPFELSITNARIEEFVFASSDDEFIVKTILLERARLSGNSISLRAGSAISDVLGASVSNFATRLSGDVPTSAVVSWQLADGGWSGYGTVGGSLNELSFEQAVASDYPGVVTGTVKILNRIEPEIDALVNWDRWMIGERELLNGEAHFLGLPNNYHVDFDLTLSLAVRESYRLSGMADGDTRSLSGFEAQISGSAGRADLTGQLAWLPSLSVAADVIATDINPAIFRTELSGRLDASARVLIDDTLAVRAEKLAVTGILNDAPLRASGDLLLSSDRQRCTACVLDVGDNRLRVDGGLAANSIAMSLSIEAPALSQLWPGLGGSATGSGNISGSVDEPDIAGRIDVAKLEINGTDIGALRVDGRGSPTSFDINADWDYGEISVTVDGTLQLADEALSGVIRSGSITEPTAGTWSLDDPLTFRLAKDEISAGAHNWSGDNGSLHVSRLMMRDELFALSATLKGLPLQLGNAWLPKGFQLLGYGNADIDLTRAAAVWSGEINWQQIDTVLRVTELHEQITDVIVPRAEMKAKLIGGGVVASAAISIDPGVLAEVDVSMERLADDAPIQGTLRLQGSDWRWASAVIPQIDRLDGTITAAVAAAGPLNAPEFSGTVEWHKGSLFVPALNVPLNDIDVVVTGASSGAANLTGSARSGDGTLQVNGQLENLMQPSRSITLAISGSAAEAINWPEYRLWATPDVSLVGDANGWRFGGQVTVPKADVELREVPVGAVTISPDVIVLGEEQGEVRATRVSGEMQLTLGDQVRFKALGLDTRLIGALKLKMIDDRPLGIEGRLTLVDGTFVAQGQKLIIEKGTVSFTGPIDDPLINVRAVRVIESLDGDVTVGLHVRGRAQDLTTTVFSQPAMADADALSYLVVGRPLSQATESDGNKLSGAAVALGLRQATRVTDQIGQAIGLDQLSLAGDGGDTTALVAGKQIDARLHARYEYGVFSRLGTLLLRYRMSRSLILEAGAGENQSIDVLYLIEK